MVLQFIQQLFQRRGGAAAPTWQPASEPTPEQARQHQAWVTERVYQNWLGPYFKAYHLRKGGAGGRRGLRVELLREEGRQGGLFFYDDSIGPGNFQHLYQLLGERIAALGYHRACHDRRQRHHEQHQEIAVKQFFKPNPTDCSLSGRCDQRYGLITLDLVGVNGRPFFIRLTTNAVREDHFTAPKSFDSLLSDLFDEPAADAATRKKVAAYYGAHA
ncbi:hypothetical protein GO988_04555 [Hymenobacter sp. HMF4947]|uniref:Uncharacterized protein n=1 Tax=Hymenobacter ginkgonis TaxID=2682976 RepID=A0A7K1TB10_9BACT|nr:hypothetical protein [Hymenobacter ginkgonis]MVN75590.1 hypothetical protein [Hymenobacter ginkgonis]